MDLESIGDYRMLAKVVSLPACPLPVLQINLGLNCPALFLVAIMLRYAFSLFDLIVRGKPLTNAFLEPAVLWFFGRLRIPSPTTNTT